MVELADYGQARQLSLYEDGKLALQILTSDTKTNGARLVRTLRARRRIEEINLRSPRLCGDGRTITYVLVDFRTSGALQRGRGRQASGVSAGAPAVIAVDDV